MNTFTKNLKRLRMAKDLTQEQAAEILGVSAQSVSRWECGTTLPDVTILPEIARLYCVSIDDLYQETAVAYDNYAQRMASVYRSTWDPVDFARADQEFRKLRRSGSMTEEDLRQYGILHQYMMRYCMVKAEELFDAVLEKGPESEPDTYWRTRRQKLYFYALIGRGQESIAEQRRLVESGSGEVREWICLIAACQYAGEHSEGFRWFQKAAERFPDTAMLYVYGGDICKELGRIEEAFRYWDRALELDDALCDVRYSKAYCYEELGQFEKAYDLWQEIGERQLQQGFDVEALRARERAELCRKRAAKERTGPALRRS